jgi:hypothetical protein
VGELFEELVACDIVDSLTPMSIEQLLCQDFGDVLDETLVVFVLCPQGKWSEPLASSNNGKSRGCIALRPNFWTTQN